MYHFLHSQRLGEVIDREAKTDAGMAPGQSSRITFCGHLSDTGLLLDTAVLGTSPLSCVVDKMIGERGKNNIPRRRAVIITPHSHGPIVE